MSNKFDQFINKNNLLIGMLQPSFFVRKDLAEGPNPNLDY